ncbi:VOC family protein [Castellaniella sp. WN]
MAKLIHLMIRVRDLRQSIDFYRDAFGFQETHRLDFPSFTLVYLRSDASPVEIELTLNKGRDSPYAHGDAYGHVAFAVADLAATHASFSQSGYRPTAIKRLDRDGETLASFFFLEDPDGYKIEVLQEGGHYR